MKVSAAPFPDTSFLCSLYRADVYSRRADARMKRLDGPLPASSFVLLEFRQSIRLQIRLHQRDATKGFGAAEGHAMLKLVRADLAAGVLGVVAVDWADVQHITETLSAKYTESAGHRLLDILHVATAIHLGLSEFLTFDTLQQTLAEAEGLAVTS
ncbi:MAG: PIN domain-containing protein [Planctomycetota bacterium]